MGKDIDIARPTCGAVVTGVAAGQKIVGGLQQHQMNDALMLNYGRLTSSTPFRCHGWNGGLPGENDTPKIENSQVLFGCGVTHAFVGLQMAGFSMLRQCDVGNSGAP